MIVDLNEERRKKQELQDDYDYLVRWRGILEQNVFIDSRHLTAIDKLLLEHPLLDEAMNLKIKSRAFRILCLEYEDDGQFDYGHGNPEQRSKREILLDLREQYRALPVHIRLELWEEMYRWLDVFEEERVQIGEIAESDRQFVYGPHVRDEMERLKANG